MENGSSADLTIVVWFILMLMIDLIVNYDWYIWYLWLNCVILEIDLLDTCLLLNCDYWTVNIGHCELCMVELLGRTDFYVGCSLRWFGWDEMSIWFLDRLPYLLGCLLGTVLLVLTLFFYTSVGFNLGIVWLHFLSHLRGFSKNCWDVSTCHPDGPSSSSFYVLFYLRNKDLRPVLIYEFHFLCTSGLYTWQLCFGV